MRRKTVTQNECTSTLPSGIFAKERVDPWQPRTSTVYGTMPRSRPKARGGVNGIGTDYWNQ